MPRRRRSADEAREEIVTVASRHLVERGPQGIRLDDVASEIGVSRQAILHHYGSREVLLRAVVERAWLGLFRDVAGLVAAMDELAPRDVLDMVDDTVRTRGNARLGAWLLLTKQGLPVEVFEGALAHLPAQLQARTPGTSLEDTRYALLLMSAALFGDAIFGERLRQALGMPDGPEARADFKDWMANRLGDALSTSSEINSTQSD
jgi:AcrR family transcriptional regulator